MSEDSTKRVSFPPNLKSSVTSAKPIEAVWAWQLDARCRGADPGIFYGSDGERPSARRIRHQRAKAICAECVVIQQCRDHALRYRERFGIWGGIGEVERHALLGLHVRRRVAPSSITAL